MKRFRELLGGSLILICVFPISGNIVFGQTLSSVVSSSQSLLQTVFQKQQTLGQEEQFLIGQGATNAVLTAWRSQHAADFLALQENAEVLGAQTEMQPLPSPFITDVTIPSDASSEMSDFIINSANMGNDFVQIHNQQIQSVSSSVIQDLGPRPPPTTPPAWTAAPAINIRYRPATVPDHPRPVRPLLSNPSHLFLRLLPILPAFLILTVT